MKRFPFGSGSGARPLKPVGVGRTLLYGLIAERRVEVRKLGRRTIVFSPSLVKLLDAQAAEPKPRRRGRPRKTGGAVVS